MTRLLPLRLHRDERGFLSPIIIFMLVALAYMIVWILNTGQMVYDKQRTQDTADAAALVHADWSARSLNVMAMNNVAASQATVILATSTAYQLTLAELEARSLTIAAQLARFSASSGLGEGSRYLPTGAPYCGFYASIPFVGGFIQAACVAFQVWRGIGAVRATAYVVASMKDYNPPGLISKSRKIIKAMNEMNTYLVDSFPERVGNEALNLVRVDDADHLVFHPACKSAKTCRRSSEGQGGDLPVEKGTAKGAIAYAEMCLAMSKGTTSLGAGAASLQMRGEYAKRGFPSGKGPLTAGGVDGRHIRDFVNDESETDEELPAFYDWYEIFGPGYYTGVSFGEIFKKFAPSKSIKVFGFKIDVKKVFIKAATVFFEDVMGFKLGFINIFQYPINAPWPRYSDEQTAEKNDFTRKFDTIWSGVCGAGGIGGAIVSKIGILPSPYWLKGRPVYAFDPVSTRKAADQMKPYRSLAVVSRKPRARLQTARFVDKTPSAYAFAESWVHNYTAFDLYTQDWLAVLVPTSLMGNTGAVSQTVKNSPAADSYKVLTQAFDKGGSNAWSRVNTH